MSVNGDDLAATDHVVDDVVSVPRSTVMVDEVSVAARQRRRHLHPVVVAVHLEGARPDRRPPT